MFNSKTYEGTIEALVDTASSLVNEIVYPVSEFEVNGSESSATALFDPTTYKYNLMLQIMSLKLSQVILLMEI